MKKLVGLVTIAILFTLTVNAQQNRENARKRTQMNSEQSATLKTKKMAVYLDLDKNQQVAVYELMKKNTDDRLLKREEFREKRQNGAALSNDERFQIQNDRLDNQLEQKAAMKNILSKQQFEKWEKVKMAKNRNTKKKMGKSNNKKQKYNDREMSRDRHSRKHRENRY
jgi:hypothetical protein